MKLLFALAILASLSCAALNPSSAGEATLLIVKSGSVSFLGMSNANLTMPIPQDGIQSTEVLGADWEIINDAHGNAELLLRWNRSFSGGDYEIRITVKNYASYSTGKALAGSEAPANESMQLPRAPRTLEGAAGLSSFVHGYVTYDLNLTGANEPLEWILENRRGVCVEFATLLKAMLDRDVETRYVLGYAYSAVEGKPVGHAWIEAKAEDGTWVGLDPTWNEAGYIDATHVVTSRGSSNQSELFSYVATQADWKRNDERVELIGYKVQTPSSLALGVVSGALQANVSVTGCAVVEATIAPCVTQAGEDALRVANKTKTAFVCNHGSFSWDFNATEGDYSCSVKVRDQHGSVAEMTVIVSRPARNVSAETDMIKNIMAWIYSILGLR